jgi:hypothetical protein
MTDTHHQEDPLGITDLTTQERPSNLSSKRIQLDYLNYLPTDQQEGTDSHRQEPTQNAIQPGSLPANENPSPDVIPEGQDIPPEPHLNPEDDRI